MSQLEKTCHILIKPFFRNIFVLIIFQIYMSGKRTCMVVRTDPLLFVKFHLHVLIKAEVGGKELKLPSVSHYNALYYTNLIKIKLVNLLLLYEMLKYRK